MKSLKSLILTLKNTQGRAILKLSDADLVVFAKGWETARGCKVEYLIASEYGLDIMML